MKTVFAVLTMLTVVVLCVSLLVWFFRDTRVEPLPFALPEDNCVPVRVAEPNRDLVRRYHIPIDDKAPYALSVERYRAFGKPCYRVVLCTILPSRSRLFEWRSIIIRDTAAHATAEQAVREAAEWWNGCN